ncbi:hypothetical protein RAD15_25455 [Bradyrhizobium sp. 14AA]
MHETSRGANGSGKVFAPFVLIVLIATGLFRHATDNYGASVNSDARVPTSIELNQAKNATEDVSENKEMSTALSPEPSTSSMELWPSAEGRELESSSAGAPVLVSAIRVEQSLFTDIRVRDNVVCAADYPFLGIGEVGGGFVALNGIARQWASKNYLSVYRGRKWVAVRDSGVDPLNVGFSETQRLIQAANDLCPSSSADILGEAAKKMKEGEARLVQLGSAFGLGSANRPQPAKKEAEKEVEEEATEVIAWHLTQGLGREAQVGQKIRTTGGMACFRFDDNDYRCVKFDRTHGRTAVLVAPDIDEPEKQIIDEHCFTFARGLNDRRCGFNVTMVVEKRRTDHLETTFIYSSDHMKLIRWSKY